MRILLGILASLFGLFFAICEVWGTFEYLIAEQTTLNYIVATGAGVAAVVSLLPAFAAAAWRGRKLLSLAIWALFAGSLVIVNAAAISRTGSATDAAQSNRDADRRADKLAADNLATAERNLAVDDDAAKAECATGRGNECRKLEAKRDASRGAVEAARAGVSGAPITKQDPLAARLASVFPISEHHVRQYQPLVLPVVVSSLSAALLTLAVWLLFPVRRTRPVVQPPADVIAPLPPVTILPKPQDGSVAKFLLAALSPAPGAAVEVADLFTGYHRWCDTHGLRPLKPDRFGDDGKHTLQGCVALFAAFQPQ